jgi:glycosyltransferase involved in cell wall biosynthesis
LSRIIFINRFFYPDYSATSQLLSDLAFYLAACGEEVEVIASRQTYDNPEAGLPRDELVRGVHVHRVLTTQHGRQRLLGRSVDYLSFYWSVLRKSLRLIRRGDVLITETDPPLLSVIGMMAASSRRATLINWLQDLFPEVAVQLRVPLISGPPAWLMTRLRDRSLRNALANVVLGHSMQECVLARGVPESRIRVIGNWIDEDEIIPVPPRENPLRRAWGLDEKFVVGYSGNLGRAHEFDTVLAASALLRQHEHIVFLFIGGGYRINELARKVRERGLNHLYRFVPYQDRAQLRLSLSVPDVHWISLKPELEGLIFPSKFYGIAAAGRPILAIMSERGEISELVRENKCGLVVEPGRADVLADSISRLYRDPESARTMGRRARSLLEDRFSRRRALSRWRALLHEVSARERLLDKNEWAIGRRLQSRKGP